MGRVKPRMKPAVRWVILFDVGRESQHPGFHMFSARRFARGYLNNLGMKGPRIARVKITEVKAMHGRVKS